ncbi:MULTISPECIES: Panacea domain-containing protein [Spirulina sp. CCY15215]|uniref:Panacea domain-containing protein n=1 Tax=Spirulina sp. CCY15215 TaxID=2767591 RepID=UPI001950FF51|nr:Panacea domain-containing protein [Spirulina major]
MEHPFNFNAEKGIEAILYIIKNGAKPTSLHISKVMYFADRKHLETYGRFICGDRYIAMKRGPVPSGIFNLITNIRDNNKSNQYSLITEIFEKANSAFYVENHCCIKPCRDINKNLFSQSDLECLDFSIQKYGNLSADRLTDLSHDRAWKKADESDNINIEDIVKTLENSEDLLEYLKDMYPGEAE